MFYVRDVLVPETCDSLVNKANLVHNLFLVYLFLSIFINLYMFRATMCPSSGETIVLMWHLVHVILKQVGSLKLQGHFFLNLFIKHAPLLCSNTTCCKFTCYFHLQGMQWPTSWRQSLRSLYNFKQYTNIIEAVQLQLENVYIYIALLQLIKVYWFCKNKKWFQVFRY